MVNHGGNDVHVTCSIIYASNKVVDRRKLWNDLSTEAGNVTGHWTLMGYFNVIARLDEKASGRQFSTKSSEDFSNFILSNGLIDVGF